MPRIRRKISKQTSRPTNRGSSELNQANPFKFHKFWASKPVDIALQYIDKYAQDRKLLLDPFAGSGVFVYAALLKNLSAVYNDNDPFALFLARNTLKSCSTKLVQDAYSRVLDRKIPKDLVSENGKVIVRRGTS